MFCSGAANINQRQLVVINQTNNYFQGELLIMNLCKNIQKFESVCHKTVAREHILKVDFFAS